MQKFHIMKCLLAVVLFLFINILTNQTLCYGQNSAAPSEVSMEGNWKSMNAKKNFSLKIIENRRYDWNGEKGRYNTMSGAIWFLKDSTETGTKWDFELDKKSLTLSKPEDFKYLGKGKYIYFQFADPAEIIIFKREE